MTMVMVMVIADADMHAGANAANMGPDANIGTCRSSAQKAQREYRSDQFLHESLRSCGRLVICFSAPKMPGERRVGTRGGDVLRQLRPAEGHRHQS